MMNIVQKSFALKLASESPGSDGHFSGVALVYGERDSLGDTIRPGCFEKSIRDNAGSFPCLWSHSTTDVLGSVSVESDTRSLQVRGHLLIDDVPKAREAHALLKARSIRGLSVGFVVLRAAPREDGGTDFTEGRLLEVSLTAVPAYESARVTQVRDLVTALSNRGDRSGLLALRKSIDELIRDGGDHTDDDPRELLEAFELLARWR